MDEIELKCPAKLNLFLEVAGKREDGFHDIETLFLPVGLYDTISVRRKPSGIDVYCDSPWAPPGRENIVFRAIQILSESAGLKDGVEARVKKEIPSGSGLGGGSSDAAGTLAALNRLFELGLSRYDLCRLGREAGSDVPFFIRLLDDEMTGFSGGAFVGRGRGDELAPAGGLPGAWFVIVYPGFSVSTAEVYGALRLTGKRRDIRMIEEHVGKGSLAGAASCLFNRLEDAAAEKYPRIKKVKESLLRAGASGALMTGSGSAVFGIAPGREAAFDIREKVLEEERGVNAYVTEAL